MDPRILNRPVESRGMSLFEPISAASAVSVAWFSKQMDNIAEMAMSRRMPYNAA